MKDKTFEELYDEIVWYIKKYVYVKNDWEYENKMELVHDIAVEIIYEKLDSFDPERWTFKNFVIAMARWMCFVKYRSHELRKSRELEYFMEEHPEVSLWYESSNTDSEWRNIFSNQFTIWVSEKSFTNESIFDRLFAIDAVVSELNHKDFKELYSIRNWQVRLDLRRKDHKELVDKCKKLLERENGKRKN